MVGAADGEDAAPDEAVPDEGAAEEDAAEDATAGGALDNPVPAAVAEALEDAAAGDTADPAAPLEAPAPTVVVDVLVTTACEDVDPLHAASSASTPPRPTTASSVRRDKGRALTSGTSNPVRTAC
jgi:hypothetical protein